MTAPYSANFINQYVKIPKDISDILNTTYSAEYESVRHCIGLIIINLLHSGEIAYSRNKNFYTKNKTQNYTYANMLNALRIAVADSYATKVQKGYISKGFEKGRSSTIAAGPCLDMFRLPEKVELDVTSMPLMAIDDRPVFDHTDLDLIRDRSAMSIPEIAAFISCLDRLYDEALKLNRNYWNKIEIDTQNISSDHKCFNRVGLTRIFTNTLMGRWYQKGEMSFQQLPKEDRVKLLINGESVAEIDYSAMHPHILYAWEGKQCPPDFYELIADQGKFSRFIAKNIFLIAINANSLDNFTRGVNSSKAREIAANKSRKIPKPILVDEMKKINLTHSDAIKVLKKSHPAIAKYLYSGKANELMLEDSNIMTAVLLKLMKRGITALPVHDSVIVPRRYESTVRRIMQDTYKKYTSFEISIK